MKKKITRNSILAGLAAGIIWGSWAYYVHWEYSFSIAIKAALTQGAGSFALGTIMTMIMDVIYKVKSWGRYFKITASVISPVLFSFSTLLVIHLINGTPNILKTILPSQPIGFVWTIVYSYKLYGSTKLLKDYKFENPHK